MEEKHTYRSQFFILLVHSILALTVLILIDEGLDIDIEAFIFASIVVVVWTYIVVRFFKITISDQYLKSYDCWGIYHTIEWKNITGVKPIRILGLKYFRIENTDSKRPLWIPHFLNNISEFKIEALKRVNNENPLKRYLDEKVN